MDVPCVGREANTLLAKSVTHLSRKSSPNTALPTKGDYAEREILGSPAGRSARDPGARYELAHPNDTLEERYSRWLTFHSTTGPTLTFSRPSA